MLFKKDSVIVIQGDSITDAGRRVPGAEDLGYGYAGMTARAMRSLYPDYNLKIYNRGISGDRAESLVERWEEDTLALEPAVVSILIGINNVWHAHDPRIGATFDIVKFEADYQNVVERTLKTGAKLVILEPFAFHHAVFPEEWRTDLWQVIEVTRKLAARYADAFIPLDGILHKEAMKLTAPAVSADGVHPAPDGHRIIARELMNALINN